METGEALLIGYPADDSMPTGRRPLMDVIVWDWSREIKIAFCAALVYIDNIIFHACRNSMP